MNKNTLIITVIILAIVGSAASLYYWQKKEPPAPIDNSEQTTQKNEDISKIDTGNWNTYRSKKYGFEIKYPDNFTAREYVYTQSPLGASCDVVMWFNKELSKTKAEAEKMIAAGENEIFSFRIYTNPTEECEQEQIIKRYTTIASSEPAVYLGEEEYVLNGIKFIKKKYLAFPSGKSRGSDRIAYNVWELIVNEKRYLFAYHSFNHTHYINRQGKDDSPTEKIFLKILSTFKFID